MTNPKELDPSSSPRAFYGAELRRIREVAGLSQDKLGELVFCSGAYIGQMESATRKPQLDLSQRLDEVLQTDGYLARLCKMVTKSRHAEYFADAAELEALAVTISEYAPALVPGLVQTAAYARAIIRASNPLASKEFVEERVSARLDRAGVLGDPTNPLFWAIIHENVIRLPVSGGLVMHEQLTHISDLARNNRVVVQVLPYSAGEHPLMGDMVCLMTFADAPPVAYVEGAFTGQLLDEPALVTRYARSYDFARAVALSPEASLALVESAMEDYAQ